MKSPILLCFGITTTLTLSAQVDGPRGGNQFTNAAISGHNQVWSSTTNVQSSDNVYSSFSDLGPAIGSYTDYLVVTNFGFDLPDGVTVFGVKVEVERSDPNGLTSDYSIRIVRAGLIGTQEKSTGIPYPATDAYQVYGGATDLWGEDLSYKDVDNNNFGVAIAAQRNATGGVTAGAIDDIQITVYYGTLTILPVNLISFDATKENNFVQLNWKSASENALDEYSLERSGDGRIFYPIATITPANLPNANYIFTDEHPLAGTSYYRLRMKESGTPDRFSKIAIVNFNKYTTIQLSPSPCARGTELSISNPGRQLLTILFYDSEGKMLGKTNTSNQQVSMPNIPAMNGMIYYRVTGVNNKLIGSGSLVVL